MTPSPTWCFPEDSLEKAARLMEEGDCGAIPVVDDSNSRRPVGIITDRDIVVRVIARGENTQDHLVRDAMSPDPIRVHGDATFQECTQAMRSHHMRRILVTDDRGKVVGIVTDGDLARACQKDRELEHHLATMVEEVSAPPFLVAVHPAPATIPEPTAGIHRPKGGW